MLVRAVDPHRQTYPLPRTQLQALFPVYSNSPAFAHPRRNQHKTNAQESDFYQKSDSCGLRPA